LRILGRGGRSGVGVGVAGVGGRAFPVARSVSAHAVVALDVIGVARVGRAGLAATSAVGAHAVGAGAGARSADAGAAVGRQRSIRGAGGLRGAITDLSSDVFAIFSFVLDCIVPYARCNIAVALHGMGSGLW
jgi:hypothetical protein